MTVREIFKHMTDDMSKQIFLARLRWACDMWDEPFKTVLGLNDWVGKKGVSITDKKQYFDPELIVFNRPVEVMIDGGSHRCITAEKFVRRCSNVQEKRVIAFEPNPGTLREMEENFEMFIPPEFKSFIEIHPYALWSENTKLSFYPEKIFGDGTAHISSCNKRMNEGEPVVVEARTLDSFLREDQTVTFIKLDVEGAELHALKGMEKTIRRCLPRLAICVYHEPEDIWEIPEFIIGLGLDYKLYLRHYSNTLIETVLYAIPRRL